MDEALHDWEVDRSRVFDWFSFSHWGLFRIPLFIAPDWFADGVQDDDDLIDRL
ncbi:MAG: hypothetical protein KGL39_60205 [Patescibacteria group bacterium]|nr:hypothetical protein [Patescibacteria group bacterium]